MPKLGKRSNILKGIKIIVPRFPELVPFWGVGRWIQVGASDGECGWEGCRSRMVLFYDVKDGTWQEWFPALIMVWELRGLVRSGKIFTDGIFCENCFDLKNLFLNFRMLKFFFEIFLCEARDVEKIFRKFCWRLHDVRCLTRKTPRGFFEEC